MHSIPKIIHYCWFGNNPKPASVLKFIENWKSVLPEYEIKEWNETNFDVNICKYTAQAYAAKKYAFVSDYARLYALYCHGGIYLDTDVEICKDFSDLTQQADVTLGLEEFNFVATSTMAAKPKSIFIKEFMESYHSREFKLFASTLDMTTNVEVLTNKLIAIGLLKENKQQELRFNNETILILEQEYFSPYDYVNFIDNRTGKTATVHHFGNSWVGGKSKFIHAIKLSIVKIFGGKMVKFIREVVAK
ncbi:glycosyltransferase [Thalassotalea ponticola]|uniref:glycosyltransferase family 32 protein n=1 Tax=Thalassotalea ponticola TaxID=1523392 RepID=UPI0025B53BC2|nr:glycosyltransferase [Thalassotalea ponticola]MDN3652652.1 glycosyltransferase [Thalassotalea ponticola]